ncbi:cystathionine beta-lyase [alpha proteobacterium AAP81b]|nr:cystathionine beta-lyase [alpha proteobacterium AAP81b]
MSRARRTPPVSPAGDAVATTIVHAGRNGYAEGIVNPPVWRASTMLFDSIADLDAALRAPDAALFYGRRGGPTHWALEDALTALEPGAAGTKLYPSGVAAIATALLSVLAAGDHVLIADSAYDPTRLFADGFLKRFGIAATYYPPGIGAGIAALIEANTRAILIESPGSLTFEVEDVPAITAIARERGIATIMDNTWATPLRFQPLAHGCDMSVQALTKYVGGHSDLMMGSVTAAESHWARLKTTTYRLGQTVSPDDAALALRGLRTLAVRLDRHESSAIKVARWLETQPLVAQVRHPALPSCPGHEVFTRDFTGATGLFAFVLTAGGRADTAALLDDLRHFGIGFSWGGFESLAIPADFTGCRTARPADFPGPVIRLSIGLEDPDDLIADLAAGLARYAAALGA